MSGNQFSKKREMMASKKLLPKPKDITGTTGGTQYLDSVKSPRDTAGFWSPLNLSKSTNQLASSKRQPSAKTKAAMSQVKLDQYASAKNIVPK